MPRLPRIDWPGRWFHVFNRGIARRPVFETMADVRFFLACLACAVRRGELEVHAYCILTTHFHLVVRSPAGDLSKAMQRVLNAYVRYYNRSRRRDGPLFRGRFGAKPVDDLRYRRILIRYIDSNAVRAGLAAVATAYPYGSARHYACRRRPLWLSTDWVDAELRECGFTEPWRAYASVFGAGVSPCERTLVQARIQAPSSRLDCLDDLLGAAPPQVLDWMRRKARLADGGGLVLPAVDPRTLVKAMVTQKCSRGPWTCQTGKGRVADAWPLAEAYLFRELAALRWSDVALRLSITPSAARKRVAKVRQLLESDEDFAARLSGLGCAILESAHGEASRSGSG